MSRPTSLSVPLPPPAPTTEPRVAPASSGDRERLAQLAAEFESMLVLEMIKTMRQSMLDEDADGEGLGADTFSSTIDTELSRHLSGQGGLGLQQYMLEAWDRQRGGGTPATSPVAPASERSGQAATPSERARGVAPTTAAVAEPSAAPGAGVAPPSASRSVGAAVSPLPGGAGHGDEHVPGLELTGRVSSAYGWRQDPFNGRARFHGGIDLAARYGTEVPSAADGTVVAAGEQGAYGMTVVVKHRDGYQTRYAHLSAIDVRVGDAVEKGALLGRVGSTGRSTGSHLHFEVSQGGQRIDPERFVRNLAGDIKGQ